MFVYRVQDSEGRGPWRPGFSHQWVEDRDDHDNLKPWFIEFGRVDKNAAVGMSIGCGCKDIGQLKRWFTKREFKKLKKLGYEAVMMDCSKILGESDIQCVFERSKPLNQGVKKVRLY